MWAKLLDIIEQPLLLTALFTLGGLVGALLFTPAFILCAICILLGIHRSKIFENQHWKIQLLIYSGVAVILGVGGYFLNRALDAKLDEIQTAFASKVASLVNKKPAAPPSNTVVDAATAKNSPEIGCYEPSAPNPYEKCSNHEFRNLVSVFLKKMTQKIDGRREEIHQLQVNNYEWKWHEVVNTKFVGDFRDCCLDDARRIRNELVKRIGPGSSDAAREGLYMDLIWNAAPDRINALTVEGIHDDLAALLLQLTD